MRQRCSEMNQSHTAAARRVGRTAANVTSEQYSLEAVCAEILFIILSSFVYWYISYFSTNAGWIFKKIAVFIYLSHFDNIFHDTKSAINSSVFKRN